MLLPPVEIFDDIIIYRSTQHKFTVYYTSEIYNFDRV